MDEKGVNQHPSKRTDREDDAAVGEGQRFQEPAEADCGHQRTYVVSGTSSPDVEPGAYESPANPERERRIRAAVGVVLAVNDDQEDADPDYKCEDGKSDLGPAKVGHLSSEVIAPALSSLLGMKPRAPLAPIASPRSMES